MPIRRLLDEGHEVCGLFFNPNIHPLAEYLRRREGARQIAGKVGIRLYFAGDAPHDPVSGGTTLPPRPAGQKRRDEVLTWKCNKDAYATKDWLEMTRAAAGTGTPPEAGPERCFLCWKQRLERTRDFALAGQSGAGAFDAFSTSLLYSRRQRHGEIAALGRELAPAALPFLYRDFRLDWQEGIRLSKEWGIYRQQYCGCIFSENERYAGEL
jgi:predicted adenine nucleotide alpha hydrolase (AANH) superfamily ATPase